MPFTREISFCIGIISRSKCTRSVRERETVCTGVRAWVQKAHVEFHGGKIVDVRLAVV